MNRAPYYISAAIMTGKLLGCAEDPCEKVDFSNPDLTYVLVNTRENIARQSSNTAECVTEVYRRAEEETAGYQQADGTIEGPINSATICGDESKLATNLACLESLEMSVPNIEDPCDIIGRKFESVLPFSDQEKQLSRRAICFDDGNIICNYAVTYSEGLVANDPNNPMPQPVFSSSLLIFERKGEIVNLCKEQNNDSSAVWAAIKPTL